MRDVLEGLPDQGGKEELISLFFHSSFRSYPLHTSCGWRDFLEGGVFSTSLPCVVLSFSTRKGFSGRLFCFFGEVDG